MEEQQAVWFTSNLIREDTPEGTTYRNQISYICPREVVDHRTEDNWTNVDDVPDVVTANGAIRFGKNLLVCSQGLREIPSSLSLISRDEDGHLSSQVILNNFHGRQFNSINDVAILPPPSLDPVLPHPTTNREDLHLEPHTTIFFTDPTYGHAQGYKNPPELPNQVYAFDPTTGDIRVVADGFSMPNGIAFDFEGDKCYITDTGVIDGRGGVDGSRPGTMSVPSPHPTFSTDESFRYVYDVVRPCISQLEIAGPTLHNRRVFAFTDAGAPDGIKCDTTGNVYSGCSDGIQVWNSHGTLLGKILLQPSRTGEEGEGNKMGGNLKSRGCANFCFVPGGRLVVLAEDRMYEVRLDGERVKGALLV